MYLGYYRYYEFFIFLGLFDILHDIMGHGTKIQVPDGDTVAAQLARALLVLAPRGRPGVPRRQVTMDTVICDSESA